MSLQIVQGKPGSGKSYHTVTMLLRYFEDWATFEHKEGKPFDRVLYTNLPLQAEAINEYLTKKIGKETAVDHYIKPIDEDVKRMFAECGGKFPLAMLPQNAMIVIDEVQKMFGSEMDTGRDKDFQVSFRNYISTHRHYGHDLIFITQHTDNISKAIIAMAEKLYQVDNVKNRGLKFPINISMADIDVVKEAFGFTNQFYRVSIGKYSGRRVKFDGETTSHLMTKEVYACYSSHTLSDVTSDRPSLNLTKMGAILWFVKRHAWHLAIKFVIACVLVFGGLHVLKQLPNTIVQSLSSSLTPAAIQPVARGNAPGLTAPQSPANVSTPKMSPPALPSPDGSAVVPVSGCGTPGCTHDHALPPVKVDEKITAIFPLGIITSNGRRRVGQPVIIEGVEEIIKTLNVRKGLVVFESGKEITVPK